MKKYIIVISISLLPYLCFGAIASNSNLSQNEIIYINNFVDNVSNFLPNQNATEINKNEITEVYKIIKANYVTELDETKLEKMLNDTYESISKNLEKRKEKSQKLDAKILNTIMLKEFVSYLDPHSGYMTKDETLQFSELIRGSYFGIGITISSEKGEGLTVENVTKGSPAYTAGIIKGDVILEVNGYKIKDGEASEAIKIIKNKSNKNLQLNAIRNGKEMEFIVVPTFISYDKIDKRVLDNNILYIGISSFHQRLSSQIREVFNGIDTKNLNGIILDMRDNPGGILDQANTLSNMFLPKDKVVVQIRGRNTNDSDIYASLGNFIAPLNVPVVILMSDLSASASEVVSAALQENNRAIVMGMTSYGKGSVQAIFNLSTGASMLLTTQLYYTPLNYSVQGVGIKPDILVKPEGYKKNKKESDYSNMLPSPNPSPRQSLLEINESICPAEKNEDGTNDYLLGCATTYILNGSNINDFKKVINDNKIPMALNIELELEEMNN